uniref:Cilia- and flagella-associated protein 91 n=1 Tax=Oncorhynchus mykiss TaxID=8022 RepID=A0A8C7QAT7_ONCMY
MSISVTRTFHKQNETNKGFTQQRVHDYLYGDPNPVKDLSPCPPAQRKVPEYGSMFSHLPHHPRYVLRLDTTDPVPAFIDRRWRGYTEQRREAVQQFPPMWSLHCPSKSCCQSPLKNAVNILGTPLFSITLSPFLPPLRANPYSTVEGGSEQLPTPFQRTMGVQTDYRDSEAQTDPYTPEYVVRPGTARPELLTLATLTWGRGLPAGLAEVEMIERTRVKRAWEATLPPMDDLSQLDKRKRMMDEMERKEWAFREDEIQKLQEARLALLMGLLRQREEVQQEATVDRLDLKYSQHQRDEKSKLIRQHMRSMRKLTAKRKNVEGKLKRRDIIKDYSNYSSQTYAPLSRIGLFPDRHSQRNMVKSRYLDTYEGLLELEAGLPVSVTEPCIKAPVPKVSKGFVKRSARREMELMKTHQALKEEKTRVEQKKTLRFLFKTEKSVPRPQTPVVDEPPEGDEERELAVIYLQKLLRGRSIQNQMFEGKEKRLELIQELRTTHALQREEQELQRADTQLTLALQRQREQHTHKASLVEGYQAAVAGAELVDMLDFLSKELIRLQEERRIHAFTLLAERDRRLREAEESGRRQMEERRRREEDEIFKQVMRVHQETVDLYLEDIILGTLDQTADQQARQEIRRVAEEVNNIAYAMEETRSSLQSEEIVAELVYSFLIPEVQKINVRDRVRQSQRRHLQAAHQIIHGGEESSVAPPPGSPGAQRPPSPSDRASSQLLEEMLTHVEQKLEGAGRGEEERREVGEAEQKRTS